MKLNFYKYQGTGNDFIMIDDRLAAFPVDDTELVARLCDRRFGIGADGLILLQQHASADFYMKYYNADGRESSMCGNGGRCIVAFAHRLGIVSDHCVFFAIDGLHEAIVEAHHVRLKMGEVQQVEQRDDFTFVLNTGSPHYVKMMADPISALHLTEEARKIRYNDEFAATGINVNYVNPTGLKAIAIRTYERGVEDETLSCGTGVTAAAISTAIAHGLPKGVHTIDAKVEGGALQVQLCYDPQPNSFSDIWLIGPASFVFEGWIECD